MKMLFRKKLEKEIIEYGKLCGIKNFTPGYSGNISARYKNGLLITTSGSSNGYLKKEHIVYTDFEGKSLEKNKKPSSEKFLHIEIYRQRADINYIIHVHAPYLSSFASSGKDLITKVTKLAVMTSMPIYADEKCAVPLKKLDSSNFSTAYVKVKNKPVSLTSWAASMKKEKLL